MRRITPLISQATPSTFGSGLAPDLHSLLTPLWVQADGVRFVNGKMLHQRLPSLAFSLPVSTAINGLGQIQLPGGVRYVYAASETSVWKWYGPAATAVTSFVTYRADDGETTKSTIFDFTKWGNWMVISNGEDFPVIDKQADGLATVSLGSFPPRFLKKKFDFLLGFGMGEARNQISWCNQGNIEDWTQGEGHSAATLTLEEFDGEIIAGETLGTFIATYSVDQMILVSYVGAPFYFGQKFGLDGIGATGKSAVCSDGRMNYGVSRKGVWRTDGSGFDYIDEGFLHEYLQKNVNWLQSGKIIAFRNDDSGCFEFHFPMGASLVVNEAWSYDPRSGAWSRCPVFTASQERRVLNNPVQGSADGKVYLNAFQPYGGDIAVRSRPLSVQGTHTSVFIDEVQLLAKTAVNCQFRIGVAEDLNSTYTYSPYFDIPTDMQTVLLSMAGHAVVTGTYWVLEIASIPSTQTYLDLQGFVLYGVADGTTRDVI